MITNRKIARLADPKSAPQVDEIDLLRLQNLRLRQTALTAEVNAALALIAAKYASTGDDAIHVNDDGSILRTPKVAKSKK